MKTNYFDEKVVLLLYLGASLVISGYLIGRFTAISDLKKGYLDCFIRNRT